MRKNRLIALIGTLTMAAAGLAAVSAGVSNKKADSVSANNGTKIYTKVDQYWWTKEGAGVSVHYWGGASGTTWPGVHMNSEGGYWSYEIPSDSTNFMFVRTNTGTAGTQGSDWGAKTVSLSFESGKDLFLITGDEVWGDPGTTGKWVKYGTSIAGGFNSWSTSANPIEKIDGNHFAGTIEFDTTRDDPYEFKVVVDETDYYGGGTNFTSSTGRTEIQKGTGNNFTLTLDSTDDSNRKIKAYFDFYKEYDGKPSLEITQTFEKKVSFDDGTASLYGYAGETVTLPSPVSVEGHTFNGWYNGSTLVGQAGASYTVPSNDIELSASWTADTYTVNYNKGANGSGTNQSDIKTYGEALTLKGAIFERDGFTQTGWSNTDGGTKSYDLNGSYTANSGTTLYPFWSENAKPKYTVNWYDGNDHLLKTEQVEEGTVPTYTGDTPEKDSTDEFDYTFNNTWSPTPAEIYEAKNYTAQFNSSKRSYTITWLNDDNTVFDTTSVEYGTVPSHVGPTKSSTPEFDYSFSAWSPTPSAVTGTATYKATFSSTTRNYNISWDANGGTIDSSKQYTNGSTPYGTPITSPTISKNGYELAGWNPALPATVGGEQEYTAQWRVPAGQYIIGGFNSWAENATGVKMSPLEESGAGEFDRIAEHVAVDQANEVQMIWVSSSDYAIQYKNAYSVTYYNSPSGRCIAGTKTEGDSGKSGDNAVLPIAGSYTIKTYKDNNLDDKYRHYAVILEEYKLEFDMGGHGTNPGTEYAIYNETFTVPTAPGKDGNYTFAGWYTDTNYVTEFDFTTAYNENKVAYAKWDYDSVPVTISFNTNGGTTISPISGYSGQSYSKPADPTKTNHIFAGWTWSGQTTPTNLPDVLPDADTEYTANWTLENGTYLAIMPNGSSSMPRNGQLKFDVHQGTQLVVKGLELHEGDQIRPYFGYGESDWNNIISYTWSHPDYAVSKSGDNVLISEDGIYDIYFTYDTGAIHVSVPTMPENGRYLAVNDDTSKDALHLMSEHQGYTGKEYSYQGYFAKDDIISAYYQDSTQATQYYPSSYESVKVWDYIADQGLKCPEAGTYSIYLISEDGGDTYNKISIFKEGEAEAVNFANKFLDKMDKTCDLQEIDEKIVVNTNIKELQAAWLEMKTEFDKLQDTSKAYLTNAVPVYDKDSTDKLGKFAASYDYIYGKYHASLGEVEGVDYGGDFAQRDPKLIADSRLFSVSNVSTSTWIIASVAIVGIAAVGVFFIYRKRKEN